MALTILYTLGTSIDGAVSEKIPMFGASDPSEAMADALRIFSCWDSERKIALESDPVVNAETVRPSPNSSPTIRVAYDHQPAPSWLECAS